MRPSLSLSPEVEPFSASTPTTWNGALPMRMYSPIGSATPASSFLRTLSPITATAEALRSSASVK
ncbi:hypothetical protein D3C76_866750 [compost metagenome]